MEEKLEKSNKPNKEKESAKESAKDSAQKVKEAVDQLKETAKNNRRCPKIIFIATYPNKEKVNPAYLDKLCENKDYVVLHPFYCYDSKVGEETLKKLPNPYPPKGKNLVDTAMRQDLYGVSQAHVLVYDLDADPGVQFITAAVLRDIPVVCV